MTIRIAVVGDVHLAFGPKDAVHLDSGAYDLVLFVGDLTGYAHRGGLKVARLQRHDPVADPGADPGADALRRAAPKRPPLARGAGG